MTFSTAPNATLIQLMLGFMWKFRLFALSLSLRSYLKLTRSVRLLSEFLQPHCSQICLSSWFQTYASDSNLNLPCQHLRVSRASRYCLESQSRMTCILKFQVVSPA